MPSRKWKSSESPVDQGRVWRGDFTKRRLQMESGGPLRVLHHIDDFPIQSRSDVPVQFFRDELAQRLGRGRLAVDHVARGRRPLESGQPAQEFALVRVAGEALDADDLGVDRDVASVDVYRLGPVFKLSPARAFGLVT